MRVISLGWGDSLLQYDPDDDIFSLFWFRCVEDTEQNAETGAAGCACVQAVHIAQPHQAFAVWGS